MYVCWCLGDTLDISFFLTVAWADAVWSVGGSWYSPSSPFPPAKQVAGANIRYKHSIGHAEGYRDTKKHAAKLNVMRNNQFAKQENGKREGG